MTPNIRTAVPDSTSPTPEPAPSQGIEPADRKLLADLHEARRAIDHRWALVVLVSLKGGPLTFAALLDTARQFDLRGDSATKKPLQASVLSRTLADMRDRDLVARNPEHPDRFVTTTLRLTPRARSLIDALAPTAQWAGAPDAV